MRFAVTADLHLTSKEDDHERFDTLAHLLQRSVELGVDKLVVAGDLFNQQQQNYADFESVIQSSLLDNLEVVILPGNHDSELNSHHFAIEGIGVVSKPTLVETEGDFQLLYVPYTAGVTLGELLAEFQSELTPRRWALISHADWLGGGRRPSVEEPGVYMPLTHKDLQLFQPFICLLGHIHRPHSDGRVHYVGSPYPLDVTETGSRRFLTFDTQTLEIKSWQVDSGRIYFDEKIIMLPVKDEREYLKRQIVAMHQSWELPEAVLDRVQLRLKVSGYCRNRSEVSDLIKETLGGLSLYPGSPDLSALGLAMDSDRNALALRVKDFIEAMDLNELNFGLRKRDILEQALMVLYDK